MNIGGEGRNDYAAPARLPEQHLKGFADLTLALGITGSLRIGRVRQQAKDALAAELRKPRKVYHTAVDGGAVYLEVTRLNHRATVALDGEGYGVGYRVIDMYHLNGERAELYHVAGGDLMELRAAEQPVLLELALDEADGELCAVNGDIDRLEQVSKAADMILVAVGDDNALYLICVALDIGKIGYDQVDARHIGVGERQTAVDKEHIVLVFIEGHILADLVEAAEERYLYRQLSLALAALLCRAVSRL